MDEHSSIPEVHSIIVNNKQLINGYEKIKVVGKGASGTAILYTRKSDQTLVVIKEINMIDLGEKEKRMALNEVKVLSLLHHPNIISYYGSFEKDGVLMIEMEYANNGTLAQMLAQRHQVFTEWLLLNMLTQIVAAIEHMHRNNILHRDLKSANVFLNMDGTVKVGDFGLSKLMTSRAQADTVLGTPYYLSPELCQGKDYGPNSDIWALGCILYEMATLKKPFQAANLTALVKKITEDDYAPLPSDYSEPWHVLISSLLQKEPSLRPTAKQIQNFYIPKIVEDVQNRTMNVETPSISPERSLIYIITSFQKDISLQPVKIARKTIIEVAVSYTHCLALTTDYIVYKWLNFMGDGPPTNIRGVVPPLKADLMDSLRGKKIKRLAAGNGFSIYVSETGLSMSEGIGKTGSLGHGNLDDQSQPKIIEILRHINIIEIKAGTQHAAALAIDGKIYTWGIGRFGCLGVGNENNCYIPTAVNIMTPITVIDIFCGPDSTAILTSANTLFVCGSNAFNKLGLWSPWFLARHREASAMVFTEVKHLKPEVKSISMGTSHSAVLTTSGDIITMGRNREGQLGLGHRNKTSKANHFEFLKTKRFVCVYCGPTYTVAASTDNVIYFWGTRYSQIINPTNHEKMFSQSVRSNDVLVPIEIGDEPLENSSEEFFFKDIASSCISETVLQPQSVLALYSSPEQIERDEIVILQHVRTMLNSVLVVAKTTTPQPAKMNRSEGGK